MNQNFRWIIKDDISGVCQPFCQKNKLTRWQNFESGSTDRVAWERGFGALRFPDNVELSPFETGSL